MHRSARIAAALILTITSLLVGATAGSAAPSSSGTTETYIVLYGASAIPADAAATIANAGGSLVYAYPQVGIAIARSDDPNFRAHIMKDAHVEGASATTRFGVGLGKDAPDGASAAAPAVPSPGTDNLSGLQWDMVQIKAPEARAINGGRSSVVVGDIDTGLDYTHPDLAANVDFANSVSCVGGVPNQDPAAWDDDNGHGTHTAGTIAAARNGIGIVGVAPNVKIAGIKAGNSGGFFFPEAVVCAFVWAGQHKIQVTNNSYFADPWLFNCRNDAEQRAIWKAEQRAIRWAMSQGVTVVSSAGNENIDLSKTNIDTTSPDNGTPLTREVTNACLVIPNGISGVIGVTAVGALKQKAYYSSYGVSVADVTAPGGDRRYQLTAAAPNGRVLSTYPAKFYAPSPSMVQDCSVSPCATYAYLQGTSMASPHAVGVAALIVSQWGNLPTGTVQALLQNSADPLPCPPNPFDPGGTGEWQAKCTGGPGYNSFYGHGLVDAYNAVTVGPGAKANNAAAKTLTR